MKITVIETDARTGMKLGIFDGKYFILMFNQKWVKIDTRVNDPLTIFHRISDQHYFEEMKRKNEVLCG